MSTMSITSGENNYLVSVSFDGSHEEQVNKKPVRHLLLQNNPTIDLTETYNYNHK